MFKGPFNGFSSQQELDDFLRLVPTIKSAFQIASSFAGLSRTVAAEKLFELVIEHGGDDADPDKQAILNAAIGAHLNAKTIDHFMDAVARSWAKYKQKAIAQKPRPKTGETFKSATIAAMRQWIDGDLTRTLNDFVQAEHSGTDSVSIKGLTINGVKRYEVDVDKFERKKLALSTLELYWTDARKRLP
ncbi:MAG: hypothetical protein ABIP34_07805 [Rhodoferax sp.]|uniref:hypothetical protein n=1 Tax=Rhodoferax sp. TaxID=50421 RepID=UPI003266F034